MLPILTLSGSPYEQGVAHGSALQGAIRRNLSRYFRRFALEIRLPQDEVLRRAARYLEALEAMHPAYVAGMRGIAAGSGVSLTEIAALNVRYEILYDGFGKTGGGIDGCTSFALTPEKTASGHLVMGENWDWIPEVEGAVLRLQEPSETDTVPEVLCFTEAGIFGGKLGLNSAGLGLAINGLTSSQDDWARLSLPFHVRCYDILRQRTLEGAEAAALRPPRACSGNFLIAQVPDRVVNLEVAPHTVCTLRPEAGALVHANHFTDPTVQESDLEERPGSLARHARLGALFGEGPYTLEDVKARLRDAQGAPNAICRHPDPALPDFKRYATVVSAVMDLHARVLYITDGPPDVAPYQAVRLGAPGPNARPPTAEPTDALQPA